MGLPLKPWKFTSILTHLAAILDNGPSNEHTHGVYRLSIHRKHKNHNQSFRWARNKPGSTIIKTIKLIGSAMARFSILQVVEIHHHKWFCKIYYIMSISIGTNDLSLISKHMILKYDL